MDYMMSYINMKVIYEEKIWKNWIFQCFNVLLNLKNN